jgi:hypothetical protein
MASRGQFLSLQVYVASEKQKNYPDKCTNWTKEILEHKL